MKRLALALVWAPGLLLAVTNSLTIAEKAGVTTPNYPVQIGRPFVAKEILHYPQVLVNGTPVLTQADVKQRYPDGSVKHAILSFLIPTLAANTTVTVTFRDQASGNNTALTKAQMLDPSYNFDAVMQLTAPRCAGCTTKTASAREVLNDWDGITSSQTGLVRYWTKGPVATTVILADHAGKRYDLGWQQDKLTTFAAPVKPADTTLYVTNASGWTAPMLIRVNNYHDQSGNDGSEDIMVCAVNTAVTPHRLTVGGTSCPNVDGRMYRNSSTIATWAAGAKVYPNIWKEPSSEQYKSFRPIFHATFWPALKKVRVRYIGEDSDTEKLQDQAYALALKLGFVGPATVYTNAAINHRALTRWTKEFWIGGPPPRIQINHNFAYLIATKFLYNFDLTKTLSFTALQPRYNAWLASNRDLYGRATMTTHMGTGGDNDHTGYYTGWDVWWLYTMDYRAQQMATESADLGAAYLFHMREGNSAKKLTRSAVNGCPKLCDEPGLGHVFSLTNRRSIQTLNLIRPDRLPGDNPKVVGSISAGGFTLGMNHAWEPYTPLYTVTGDFWYLEEAWMWAGFGSGYALGTASIQKEYMRGPTGAEGTIPSEQCSYDATNHWWYANPNWTEIRTSAWILRIKANTAFVSPDDTPEKSYFETLVTDTMAGLEGWHNIQPSLTTPSYLSTWNWGKNIQYATNCGISPLHIISRGGREFVQISSPYYGINSTFTAEANGYGIYYMMFALGRAAELGFPARGIGEWSGQFFVDLITGPGANPNLIQMGRMPTIRKSDHQWINSWPQFTSGYTSNYATLTSIVPDGYAYKFAGAVAVGMAHQVTQDAMSAAAWNFVKSRVMLGLTNTPDQIKWAIVPRVP